MTIDQLAAVLSENPNKAVHFLLPDGSSIPAHFHVTEVGRVQKDFVDCGGTVRNSTTCVVQVWVANDLTHRLDTTKFSRIISKGIELFDLASTPLDVEYDNGSISQYTVNDVEASPSGVTLHLGATHTACLALDRCGIGLDILSSCSTADCC